MGSMRITFRCHEKGCHEWIDESRARLVGVNWYYCNKHAPHHGGI